MKWFLDMSTRGKILLCFGLLLSLMLVIVMAAYSSISRISNSQKELFYRDVKNVIQLVELRSAQNRARAQLLEMMLTKDRNKQILLERDIKERSQDVESDLKDLLEINKNEPGVLEKLRELNAVREEYRRTRDEEISLVLKGDIEKAKLLGTGVQEERYNKIRDIAVELGKRAIENSGSLIASSQQSARKSIVLFLCIGIVSLVFCGAMTLVFNRMMAAPLREISAIAERIAAGDLSVPVPSGTRKDEVGILTQAFARMVASLLSTAEIARRVSEGDLSVKVTPQSEKDVMGNALASMVGGLRELTKEVVEGVNVLASSSSEITASTSQVVSGATETATAVSETTATVEEVKQTAQVSNQKSKNVSDAAQRAVQAAQSGKKAVEDTIGGMNRIQAQVTFIADSIMRLSEQSQTIGDIITTVNDLAEQSNLLAVNAAIEAAKAGEQGKGFAVVAQEIRSLAEQSKDATAQVRSILSDIQKATNAAVLSTEQGNKAVEAGVKQSKDAGEAIRQMGESIEESAHAAVQIAASSQQQLTGMSQIAQAMENIKLATEQNVGGMKQVEATVQGLHELGQKLKLQIERYKI